MNISTTKNGTARTCTTKLIHFIFSVSIIPLLFPFADISFARQIQMVPIPPVYQSGTNIPSFIQRQQPIPHTSIQAPEAGQISEFEQFISGKIDITDKQLSILRNYGIAFSQTIQPSPTGKIKLAVRIIKAPQGEKAKTGVPVTVNAGFLIGTQEQFSAAFNALEIKSPLSVTTGIRQFGYNLFRDTPSTFAPVENVPVGPGYILGPGDEIRITIWGKIEGQWNVTVDRDGKISLPKVGIFGVTGLTFKELKDLLHKQLSKIYTGFEMNVSMGSLRTIRIYVVGNAQRPGVYTISSLSTLINALFETGGPGKTGTMRDIQVKRNGQIVSHFDMYDFLLHGDKTKDIRLMPEDVVFIPPVGPVVAIAGSVNNPAIYELKEETAISQLIEMAGGLNVVAFKGRLQIERIMNNSRQTVFESSMDTIRDKSISLQSGDVVKIYRVVEDKKVVRLFGAVHREGDYGFSPGMTVKDLISMAGGLKYYAYDKEAELTRVFVTDEGPITENIPIHLASVLKGEPDSNILLKENDYLFVRTVPEWRLYQRVSIRGEVKYPGSYTIMKGERLSSLIERAGGYTDKAYLRGAVFTRVNLRQLQQRHLNEMAERLEREFIVTGAMETATAISPEEAKIKGLEIRQKRAFIEKLKSIRAKGRMAIILNQPGILKQTASDIELEEGDSLFVPSNPQSVQVIGAVYNQTAFVYDKGKSASRYIDLAGGYTRNADKKSSYILKADGTAVRPRGGFLSISWNKDSNEWEFGSRNLEPGDTIVVPEKLEKIAWMREIKDITQILYQIAVTAGVLIVAF